MWTIGKIWSYRPLVLTILCIVLLLPVILSVEDSDIPKDARKCLYVLIIMAISWVTEAVPIPVTALYPLVFFPMAGVMSGKATASAYVTDTTMLFIGGLMVAVAVEESNLHKRIAMAVMLMVGSDPKWIMAGLMVPTWFLSMWISNTATASMMIPIATAILEQMKTTNKELRYTEDVPNGGEDNLGYDGDPSAEKIEMGKKHTAPVNGGTNGSVHKEYPHIQEDLEGSTQSEEDSNYARKCRGLTLCIAYAANIGGIGTLTGTPPNLVLRDAVDALYLQYSVPGQPAEDSPISFGNWMGLAVPLSFLTLLFGWALLVIFFLTGRGCCTKNASQAAAIKKVIRDEWNSLGKITFAEVMMLVLFMCLAALWLSRDPKESPGWSEWFDSGFPTDATSAMLIATLLFILPSKLPWKDKDEDGTWGNYKPLLTWQRVHEKMPWGVLLLLGGGFSLAKAVKSSGLADWLADQLQSLDYMETWEINLALCLIVAAFTEVTSNTATAQILMPILSKLAIDLDVNPIYFMSSACLATSFAFMLPVATPPNAIVFSYGHVRVIDMTCVGFFMNIIAVGCLSLGVNTWGDLIYDFDDLDPIFSRNLTTAASAICITAPPPILNLTTPTP